VEGEAMGYADDISRAEVESKMSDCCDLAVQSLRVAARNLDEALERLKNSGLPGTDKLQAVILSAARRCHKDHDGIQKTMEERGTQ
jgi:hypothetical protein